MIIFPMLNCTHEDLALGLTVVDHCRGHPKVFDTKLFCYEPQHLFKIHYSICLNWTDLFGQWTGDLIEGWMRKLRPISNPDLNIGSVDQAGLLCGHRPTV